MDGVANAAVHVRGWKFTTLRHEVGSVMMLRQISSLSVRNVTNNSIPEEFRPPVSTCRIPCQRVIRMVCGGDETDSARRRFGPQATAIVPNRCGVSYCGWASTAKMWRARNPRRSFSTYTQSGPVFAPKNGAHGTIICRSARPVDLAITPEPIRLGEVLGPPLGLFLLFREDCCAA
jgi:hypothetical protein